MGLKCIFYSILFNCDLKILKYMSICLNILYYLSIISILLNYNLKTHVMSSISQHLMYNLLLDSEEIDLRFGIFTTQCSLYPKI